MHTTAKTAPAPEKTTGSAEFTLFCRLMAIHNLLDTANYQVDEELQRKLSRAVPDSKAIITFMINTITEHIELGRPKKNL